MSFKLFLFTEINTLKYSRGNDVKLNREEQNTRWTWFLRRFLSFVTRTCKLWFIYRVCFQRTSSHFLKMINLFNLSHSNYCILFYSMIWFFSKLKLKTSTWYKCHRFLWKCNYASRLRWGHFRSNCSDGEITLSTGPLSFNPALVRVEHHSSHLGGTAPLKHSLWQVSARGALWKMRAITEEKHITLRQ